MEPSLSPLTLFCGAENLTDLDAFVCGDGENAVVVFLDEEIEDGCVVPAQHADTLSAVEIHTCSHHCSQLFASVHTGARLPHCGLSARTFYSEY